MIRDGKKYNQYGAQPNGPGGSGGGSATEAKQDTQINIATAANALLAAIEGRLLQGSQSIANSLAMTVADGNNIALGAKGDLSASNPIGVGATPYSVISLLKNISVLSYTYLNDSFIPDTGAGGTVGTFGRPTDVMAADDTGNHSMMAFIKRNLSVYQAPMLVDLDTIVTNTGNSSNTLNSMLTALQAINSDTSNILTQETQIENNTANILIQDSQIAANTNTLVANSASTLTAVQNLPKGKNQVISITGIASNQLVKSGPCELHSVIIGRGGDVTSVVSIIDTNIGTIVSFPGNTPIALPGLDWQITGDLQVTITGVTSPTVAFAAV